jgi:hypothetical protein
MEVRACSRGTFSIYGRQEAETGESHNMAYKKYRRNVTGRGHGKTLPLNDLHPLTRLHLPQFYTFSQIVF